MTPHPAQNVQILVRLPNAVEALQQLQVALERQATFCSPETLYNDAIEEITAVSPVANIDYQLVFAVLSACATALQGDLMVSSA